ncbi:hypothetical protein GCM10011491_14800 [Brucella endophytica]|uniref:Uncharacterized protein n=1 Tax=Brucella endophytica TaxID=1963359 RepID=A0A916S8F6_9HYPH|nr:hypothetical protein [Brucella endophytica]GGA88086.1 hypothetical protein GCM10011491_14800 [Brucella endophytica]
MPASGIIDEPYRFTPGKRTEKNVNDIGVFEDMDGQADTAATGYGDIEIGRALAEAADTVGPFANRHMRAKSPRSAIDDFDQGCQRAATAIGHVRPKKFEYIGRPVRQNGGPDIYLSHVVCLVAQHGERLEQGALHFEEGTGKIYTHQKESVVGAGARLTGSDPNVF